MDDEEPGGTYILREEIVVTATGETIIRVTKDYSLGKSQKPVESPPPSAGSHAREFAGNEDDNPHQCHICTKRFATLCKLNEHALIHITGKPYKCEMCEARFKCYSELKLHRKNHPTLITPLTQCNTSIGQHDQPIEQHKSVVKHNTGIEQGKPVVQHKHMKLVVPHDKPVVRHNKPVAEMTFADDVVIGDIMSFTDDISIQSSSCRLPVHLSPVMQFPVDVPCESSTAVGAAVGNSEPTVGGGRNGLLNRNQEQVVSNLSRKRKRDFKAYRKRFKPDDMVGSTNVICELNGERNECEKKETAIEVIDAPIVSFSCWACDQSFTSPNEFVTHMKDELRKVTGENDTVHKCSLCFNTFTKYASLVAHHHNTHTPKRYMCKLCKRMFVEVTYLQFHMQKAHGKLQLGKSSPNPAIPNKLLKNLLWGKLYKCSKCHKAFEIGDELVVHSQLHDHTRKRYTCPVCPERLVNMESLQHHLFKHLEHRCVCSLCQLAFPNGVMHRVHMATHRERKYVCSVCNLILPDINALQSHQNSSHLPAAQLTDTKSDNVSEPCRWCGMHINGEERDFMMNIHLRSHPRPPVIPCELCDAFFTDLKGWAMHHHDCHNPDFPYQCAICGKTCKRLKTLGYHSKKHPIQQRAVKHSLSRQPSTTNVHHLDVITTAIPSTAE